MGCAPDSTARVGGGPWCSWIAARAIPVEAVAYHHAPHSISQSKFEPLAALAVANALLPTDDTNAFGVALVSGLKVDSTFLSRVNAPFDWAEAAQRVAKTVCTAKLWPSRRFPRQLHDGGA